MYHGRSSPPIRIELLERSILRSSSDDLLACFYSVEPYCVVNSTNGSLCLQPDRAKASGIRVRRYRQIQRRVETAGPGQLDDRGSFWPWLVWTCVCFRRR